MKQKLLLRSVSYRWFFLALLLTISMKVFSVNFTYKGITYTVISEEEKTCRTANNSNTFDADLLNIVLPEYPNGYKLVEIGGSSFYNTDIVSVSIPNTVTKIGEEAFTNCKNLSTVKLSNSLEIIGGVAFSQCSSLSSITLPETITTIGNGAFASSALTIINFPFSLQSIGSQAFFNCKIKEVYIPENVSEIGEMPFCSNLMENINVSPSNEAFCSIDGLLYNKGKDHLIQCPATKTQVNLPSSLKSIGNYAFWYCTSLDSIILPESVVTLGEYAFFGCSKLTSIKIPEGVTVLSWGLFSNCTSLKEIQLNDKILTIGNYAFQNNTSLKKIQFPSSLINLEGNAFNGCTSLSEIVFAAKADVEELGIGSQVFNGCTNLAEIYLPAYVSNINDGAFYGVPLKSINVDESNLSYSSFNGVLYNKSQTTLLKFPEGRGDCVLSPSLEEITPSSFVNCANLKTLTFPNSIKFSKTSQYSTFFSGCKLTPLRFDGDYTYNTYSGLPNINMKEGSYILCKSEYVDKYSKIYSGPVVTSNDKYAISYEPYILGIKVLVNDNSGYDESFDIKDCVVEISRYGSPNVIEEIKIDRAGEYWLKGLGSSTSYTLCKKWILNDGVNESLHTVRTKDITFTKKSAVTKTEITISDITVSSDTTFTASQAGVIFNSTETPYNGNGISYKKLLPATKYGFTLYAKDSDNKIIKSQGIEVSTEGWNCSTRTSAISPTVAELSATFNDKGATVSKVWWSFNGEEVASSNASFLSLTPEKEYTATFNLRYGDEKEGKTYSWEQKFKTTALELTTLQPKCVSNSCAIVAAETNISDLEPSAGFEWKKFDAPASLKPTEGYAIVSDGMLEGYIRNLQSTSYYNVRAFYKDSEGKYYYGETITFDPSDFSYFEPTVRTYPVQNVSGNTATVRGYVLPGTDNILGQGFQYWKNGPKKVKGNVPAESDIMTVKGTGQVMTVTLEDLEEATEYTFRVFVQTEAGYTYGDEQTFTTEGTSSIDSFFVDDEEADVKVIGYFNLYGLRSDRPFEGLNIVVYSDGSSRKVIY